MLISQIKRIISSEKNGLTTSIHFFFNAKDLGRTTLNGEKQRSPNTFGTKTKRPL